MAYNINASSQGDYIILRTRSNKDRRKKKDQRAYNDPNYEGPERRSVSDKRYLADRRYQNRLQTALSIIDQEPAIAESVKEKAGRDLVGKNQETSELPSSEGRVYKKA
jgi:hypothetical protein